MTISFVIPFYNEERRIRYALSALLEGVHTHGLRLEEVIFVDDGSVDISVSIVERYKPRLEKKLRAKVTILSYKKNRGKGAAVRTGMLASSADYTLFFDVDMSTPLSELGKFAPLMKRGYDVIVGTRKNGKATVVVYQPLYRQLLGKGFTTLSNMLLSTNFTDFTCGFKAFSKQAKDHVFGLAKIDGWGYDAEILFLSNKFNYHTCEIPVLWANNERSKVNLLKDIVRSLTELVVIRITDLIGGYSTSTSLRLLHQLLRNNVLLKNA